MFDPKFIAQKELLAALVAIFCLKHAISRKIIRLYSDNEPAVQWLKKARTSNKIGNNYLVCWELQKYKLRCKISPEWIPGQSNTSADKLSRGNLPEWLERRGSRKTCRLSKIEYYIANPELSWSSILPYSA